MSTKPLYNVALYITSHSGGSWKKGDAFLINGTRKPLNSDLDPHSPKIQGDLDSSFWLVPISGF